MSTKIYLHPFRMDNGLWCEVNLVVSEEGSSKTHLKNTLQINMHNPDGYRKLIDALTVYFGAAATKIRNVLDPAVQRFVKTTDVIYWRGGNHQHATAACYWESNKFYLTLDDQGARDLVASWYDSGYLDQLAAP